MGNHRQVLKEKIEKDLTTRIQEAESVLRQLNQNLEINKQNSRVAKDDIRITADLIKDILTQRKKELIKEVDSIHEAEVKSIQEAIKSTYLTLGSLQSTLTNLDTFDQGQLVNLQILPVDSSCVTRPAQIGVSLKCEPLQDSLRAWGEVTTVELECDRFEDALMGSKLVHSLPIRKNSECSKNAAFQSTSRQDNTERREAGSTFSQGWWNAGGQEQWLSRPNSKRHSLTDNDENDFLMVPEFENEDIDATEDFVDDMLEYTKGYISKPRHDSEVSSSIVCIEKEGEEPQDDLSMWLKPKKSAASSSCLSLSNDQEAPKCQPVLLNVTNVSSDKGMSNSTKPKILEFPCLQMDSDSWIRRKRTESLMSSSASSSSPFQFNTSNKKQRGVPPTYDLPYPYWLKKYR